VRIGFFGAAGEVTGSCTLVETDGCRFLVDCGMFQGGREARTKNLNALKFGFDVRSIDFVLLTHAHIDHSGLLPMLSVLGYRGPVYATPATIDLLHVLLRDSAHIQEKESEWALRHQRRRGHDSRPGAQPPLYTVAQAEASLKLLRPAPYRQLIHPAETVAVNFHDLGMTDRPVLHDPEQVVPEADVLFIESTYGDRLHRPFAETENEIVAAFERTRHTHGNLIMPAFAVGRTQEIIYILADLVRRQRLAPLKIFVDSPMATAATRITWEHPDLMDSHTRELIAWMKQHPKQMQVEFVADVEASRALNEVRSGAVIISASGMCEAGRIKYHLRENLPRSECSILITGFQAAGTLGRRLVDGARLVNIFGKPVAVRAAIHTVGGLSAHADQAGLLAWLRGFHTPPKHAYVVHGEAAASAAFAQAIHDQLGWPMPHLPFMGERITL
jgi:metallo-beta-lactamase family protein